MGQRQLSVSALAQPDKINYLPLYYVRSSRVVMAFTVSIFLSSVLSVTTAASPPYPPSNVIKNIVWAPVDTITRKALRGLTMMRYIQHGETVGASSPR